MFYTYKYFSIISEEMKSLPFQSTKNSTLPTNKGNLTPHNSNIDNFSENSPSKVLYQSQTLADIVYPLKNLGKSKFIS